MDKIKYLLIVLTLSFTACNTPKKITDRSEITVISAKKLFKNHKKSNFDQNSLSADIKFRYDKNGKSQSLAVKLRIEKDKKIWLSGTVFGFPVAKAIITPDRVSYYLKINKTYFDGDFTQIKKLLGTDVDFTMLQNLLLGDAVTKNNPKDFVSTIDAQAHYLSPKEEATLVNLFYWIHPLNYKIEKQEVRTADNEKSLTINYYDYTEINNTFIPGKVALIAKDTDNHVTVTVDYKSVKVGEQIATPYTIPDGYRRIFK